MSDTEQRLNNPQHASAQKDLISNTLWGIATWPLIEGISSVVNGGKFWTGIKDSVATKRGLYVTVGAGVLTGIASTLINAALGKYKKPTLVIHQTTQDYPPQEQAGTTPANMTQPAITVPKAHEPTTTHTTTTVFAEREADRREAAATAQPSVA